MENTLDLATREIMWNVPYSFKVTMYVLLFVSLGIFAKGVKEKLQFVAGEGKSLKDLFGKNGLINTENGFSMRYGTSTGVHFLKLSFSPEKFTEIQKHFSMHLFTTDF